MKNTANPYLIIALLCGVASSLPATELESAPGGPPFRAGWREVKTQKTAAEELLKEPNYKSKQPLYLALPLGSGKDAMISGVLDETQGTGKGFDTLYLDTNNNGDLTDDPALHPKTARGSSLDMEPVRVTVKYAENTSRALWVKLEIRRMSRKTGEAIDWSVGCHIIQHMEGRVHIGGRDLLIGIYDCSNSRVGSNGCFNDYCVDRLRIDINEDGKLDRNEEDFPLSRLITLDRKTWWKLEVDGGARHTDVSPCNSETGTLRLQFNFTAPAEMVRGKIEFLSDHGYGFVYNVSGDKPFPFPESVYRIAAGHFVLTDSEGKTWTSVFKIPQSLTIKRGETTVVQIGARMKMKATLDRWPIRGNKICVFPGLTGVGGEEYENISPSGTRMRPHVKIVDSEEIVVSQGKMDYG